MKKIAYFLGWVCASVIVTPGFSAVAIKKAAPVATSKSSGMTSTMGVVSGVLDFVGAVKDAKQKQQEISAECYPSAQELNFVNNMVKEWAKTGAKSASEAFKALGSDVNPCSTTGEYAQRVKYRTDSKESVCFDVFDEPGEIWNGYPRADAVQFCSDGASSCNNKKYQSNIYDIFRLVDFGPQDYSADEITMANKLLSKNDACSAGKLNAKVVELWQNVATNGFSSITKNSQTGTSNMEVILKGVQTFGGGSVADGLGAAAPMLMNFIQ